MDKIPGFPSKFKKLKHQLKITQEFEVNYCPSKVEQSPLSWSDDFLLQIECEHSRAVNNSVASIEEPTYNPQFEVIPQQSDSSMDSNSDSLLPNKLETISPKDHHLSDIINHLFQSSQLSLPLNNQEKDNISSISSIQAYFREKQEEQRRQRKQGTNLNVNQQNITKINSLSLISQLNYIHNLIDTYRKQLNQLQQQFNRKLVISDQEKLQLKNIIDQLTNKMQSIKVKQDQRQNYILRLHNQNSQLKNQIMRYNCKQRKQIVNHKSSNIKINQVFTNEDKYSANHSILKVSNKQYQDQRIKQKLQQMVEKLIVQVQYLRKINQRMSYQIQNLNNEIVHKQKIIRKGAQQIYKLQLGFIKNCIWTQNRYQYRPKKKSSFYNSQKTAQSTTTQIQNQVEIPLTDIINTKAVISGIQKFLIALKIIQFYQLKLNSYEYQLLLPQDIFFTYKKGQLQSMELHCLSKSKNSNKSHRQSSETLIDDLLCNMNFLLDQLFKENNKSKSTGLVIVVQQLIRQKICHIFNEQMGNKYIHIQEIKQILKNLLLTKNNQSHLFE